MPRRVVTQEPNIQRSSHSTAEALAAELGVSRRTLHRDLAILRDRDLLTL